MTPKRLLAFPIVMILSTVLVMIATGVATAQDDSVNLPRLFKQAQQQFQAGEYEKSLATLKRVDEISQRPGYEKDRQQLVKVLPFYRAANLAMLRREKEAVKAFREFLIYQPNASLAKGAFPRRVLEAFEKAQKEVRSEPLTLTKAYERFRKRSDPTPNPVDENWAKSAVRYLLNEKEQQAWKGLNGAAERRDFVEAFWAKLDPTPKTSVNELRREFGTRLRFADEYLSEDGKSGSRTDRGLVFVFMGPPSFVRVSSLDQEGSAIQQLREGTDTAGALRGSLQRGRRETWTYRGERVPEIVGTQQLEFDFLTREGYGDGVLEKGSRSMYALRQVARAVRKKGRLT